MHFDYKVLGLKCGLECHQQLDGKKLFCECPAEINDKQPDRVILRSLRAVAGETGELDIAAAGEQRKAKYFSYNLYKNQTCLVDIDEEPPHDINRDALATCLVVAKLVHAHLVDEIQVMRKTVVDGSTVSGFQRTALVAYDGSIVVDDVTVGIPTICLEEEAAKIVERTPEYDVYNLSRLGISLIEIATTPNLTTPELVKKAAEKIGMILRSTHKVKRGLGTIRQDVNVSIKNGARVEIKGAQDLKLLPKLVELEVQRQYTLLKIRDELKMRALNFSKPTDMTNLFAQTQCTFIQKALQAQQVVYGIKIGCFRGFFCRELGPNRRFGTELSEYAKVATGSGIMHSDELPKYGISQQDVDAVKKMLGCGADDSFVITAAPREKAMVAMAVVRDRVCEAAHGVPKEVRNAHQDGTTSYLRPMPGAARMYPETDVKTIVPLTIAVELPELLEDTAEKLQAYGLSKDLAELLVKEDKAALFVDYVARFKNVKPAYIAELLWPKLVELRRDHGIDLAQLTDAKIELLLSKLDRGEIPKEAVEKVLVDLSKKGVEDVDFMQYKGIRDAQLEKEIRVLVQQHPGSTFSFLMGKAMEKYRGKVDGKKVSEMVKNVMG